MTPLERAVKAAGEIQYHEPGKVCRLNNMLDDEDLLEIVVAVIRAIREPSEAMIAATDEHDNNWGYLADGRPCGPDACWQAMIDALLAEHPAA